MSEGDEDGWRPHVYARVPDGAGVDVEGILERLRVAQEPALTHNAWRDTYVRDVRFLLDQLRGGPK